MFNKSVSINQENLFKDQPIKIKIINFLKVLIHLVYHQRVFYKLESSQINYSQYLKLIFIDHLSNAHFNLGKASVVLTLKTGKKIKKIK